MDGIGPVPNRFRPHFLPNDSERQVMLALPILSSLGELDQTITPFSSFRTLLSMLELTTMVSQTEET